MKKFKRVLVPFVVFSLLVAPVSVLTPASAKSTEKIAESIAEEKKKYEKSYEKVDFRFSEKILEELTQYEKDHPKATEDEINEHFLELCEIYNKDNKNIKNLASSSDGDWDDFYDYADGVVTLNPKEQELYDQSPSKGFKALMAGKGAWNYTELAFGRNGTDEESDAFRHALWNMWIVWAVNDSWAEKWTSAHEDGASYQNKKSLTYKMDMHNNEEGRYKAAQEGIDSDSSRSDVKIAIDELYKSGKLKKINKPNRKESTWTLERFTGKEEDYADQDLPPIT
ncbi:DUF6973 domain-containing protein [Brevibacillus formosus]|uniref:DUF6973 domain-containing protein n=1 Tax=Brevibacillus formosus TaxID=54913 RepID=UPI003F1E126C